MKKTVRVIAAAAICLAAQNSFAYITFGAPDCGQWLKANSVAQARDESWLLGFLSGMNASAFGKVDVLEPLSSARQAVVWMDNYCRKNPLSNVNDGGIRLFWELEDKANKVKSRK